MNSLRLRLLKTNVRNVHLKNSIYMFLTSSAKARFEGKIHDKPVF